MLSDRSDGDGSIGRLAERVHDLAAGGANLESVLCALVDNAGLSLDIVAETYLCCSRRAEDDDHWARAAALLATAMRTGLFLPGTPPRRRTTPGRTQ